MKTYRHILLLGAAVFLTLGAFTTASAGHRHHGYYRYHRGGVVIINPAPVYAYRPYYGYNPYYGGYYGYPNYGGGLYLRGGWGGGHWGGHGHWHHR